MTRIIWLVFAVSELLGPTAPPSPPPPVTLLPPFEFNIDHFDVKAFP